LQHSLTEKYVFMKTSVQLQLCSE